MTQTVKPLQNFSLSELRAISGLSPKIKNFPSRILITSYDDFVGVLNSDLDHAIVLLQDNANLVEDDGEDRLTADLVGKLNMLGYDANHDPNVRGHCDVVVKDSGYTWLGEAKVHSTYNHLWEGFQQLCTRYSSGDPSGSRGGLIIYLRVKKAVQVMEKWQEHLADGRVPQIQFMPCQARPRIAFYSSHISVSSGLPYQVRHMGVILDFDPQDKSGRNRRSGA